MRTGRPDYKDVVEYEVVTFIHEGEIKLGMVTPKGVLVTVPVFENGLPNVTMFLIHPQTGFTRSGVKVAIEMRVWWALMDETGWHDSQVEILADGMSLYKGEVMP